MAADDAAGVLGGFLDVRNEDAGGGGRDNHLVTDGARDVGEKLTLDVEPFGPVLLYEPHACEGLREVSVEG